MKGFFCLLACLLANIGAINWGLVAFYKFNLIEYIVGMTGIMVLGPVLYGLVALSGIYGLVLMFLTMYQGCQICK